jgi:hypothetical protein
MDTSDFFVIDKRENGYSFLFGFFWDVDMSAIPSNTQGIRIEILPDVQ